MLDKLRRTLQARSPIAAPPDEYRNPMDTGTLNEFLLDLATRPEASGIFNLGSVDSISRYDLVRRLARAWNCPESLVSTSLESHTGRAPRGKDHFLISEKISAICGLPVPTCERVLERCLRSGPI
jgi:dTDP-4-dehydrorhamnose reductase